jgi:hypothetical protein
MTRCMRAYPMKYVAPTNLALLLCVVGAGAHAFGQESIRYQVRPGVQVQPGTPDGPDTRFQEAEAKLSSGTYDPAADALLLGTEKFTKALFHVPSLKFQRAVTERVPAGPRRGDVLIVEWTLQEQFGKGSIILTDTPYFSAFVLRVSECQIHSQAGLTTFLDSLISVGRQTTPLPGPDLPGRMSVSMNSPAITWFNGWTIPYSPYPSIADFGFSALLVGTEWVLEFRVGRSRSSSFYPVPPWVPERFPPLSELIKSWSSDRIHNEIGNPVKPFEGAPDFTADRDRILMGELASRGLAPAQVTEFLTKGPATADGYSQRLSLLIAGFAAAGMSFEKQYFTPTLATYDHIGPVAGAAVTVLFRAASAAGHGCSPKVESQALAEIKKGIFLQGPINYAAVCSSSPETLAALEVANMPTGDLEKSKEFATRQIRNRIDRTRKGIPQKKSAQIQ